MALPDQYFMRLAIEHAAQSPVQRPDDPLVGAVLVRDGSLVDAAFRSKYHPGDHAEFTLLQKQLRSLEVTAGATLFTTLEPCTTRSHDKRPCAEWIVAKGIKRVVIGILDPNPSICGRGYWHLVDRGIAVDFFPPDLASEIIDLCRGFVTSHRRPALMTPAFISALQHQKEAIIAPYTGLAWGSNLSLQSCPNLREGWPLDQIELTLESETPFALPAHEEEMYRHYLESQSDDNRFHDDGEKFFLCRNPIAFTDATTLTLKVRPTRYSVAHFYSDTLLTQRAKTALLIDDLIRGSLEARFPHRFCMHLIVVTADQKLLLTRRSPKTDIFHNSWAVSIEEQLSRADLVTPTRFSILKWAERSLREELGIDPPMFHKDQLRALSVFLEAHVPNISLCVYAEVAITADNLDLQLRLLPRSDYEFQEWAFLDIRRDLLLHELFSPTHQFHPTSGYRLLSTFLKHFGIPSDKELELVLPQRGA